MSLAHTKNQLHIDYSYPRQEAVADVEGEVFQGRLTVENRFARR